MKIKLLLLIWMLCASIMVNAKGGIPIIYSDGEDVCKVLDLPSSEEFTIQAEDGRWYHADLGILHEQFSLFYIPLINYGTKKYILFSDVKIGDYDFTYYELTSDEIEYLQSRFAGIPTVPELPFWDAWGGKLLVILLIFIVYCFANAGMTKE